MIRVSDFGDRLKQYREENGYTLEFLSKKTKTPIQTLSRYELKQRVPKIDVAVCIAECLGINPLWLQGYDVSIAKESAPDQLQLTEGEKAMLDLFNRVPVDQQQLVLQMIRAALGSQE